MDKQLSWKTEYGEPELWLLKGLQDKEKMKFPQDYLDCVLKYQGGVPSLRRLDIKNYGTIFFNYLLTFIPFDDLDVLDKYNFVRSKISERLFPFAVDVFWNTLCFDYRKSNENPEIVYCNETESSNLDTQSSIFYVCDTFTDLLNLLY